MDSIFPGLGPNPFETKQMVDYFNVGRKSGSGTASQGSQAYPTTTQRAEVRLVGTPQRGRGQVIDFMA